MTTVTYAHGVETKQLSLFIPTQVSLVFSQPTQPLVVHLPHPPHPHPAAKMGDHGRSVAHLPVLLFLLLACHVLLGASGEYLCCCFYYFFLAYLPSMFISILVTLSSYSLDIFFPSNVNMSHVSVSHPQCHYSSLAMRSTHTHTVPSIHFKLTLFFIFCHIGNNSPRTCLCGRV